ncbi:homeobox protein Hox-D12-like [Drosophila willistoni]|uniref:homeobox protein Hox-D12-like n=1 Tax=Drosophila willistoni TaxID=7260 RepID=UPI001F08467F|nr:homeobox protein Hox-D12-like [Drosophila willistoni]
MDFPINIMYANPIYTQNFFGIHQNQIYLHPNYLNSSASTFGSFGDIYRFEDGSGDERGPLLLGRSSYCGFGRFQGQGLDQNETEEGGVGGHRDVGRRHSVTTMATATTMAASLTMILSSRSSRFGLAEMNRNVVQPSMDIGEQRQQQYHRQQTGISMSFSMLLARSLTEEPTRINPNILPSVDGVPFIMLGQERFELEPETIFVLGMNKCIKRVLPLKSTITEGPLVSCPSTPSSVTPRKPVGRKNHSEYQVSEMELEFKSNMYLTPEKCQQLAEKLQLTDRQLKAWLSNRRTKVRKLSMAQEEPIN